MVLDLRGDCTRCAALCCVGLAFDRSEHFAYDKRAGDACVHLTTVSTCCIHADRADNGFAGCERYDCGGAGQRVTAMFPKAPVSSPMLDAFRAMREVHELWLLLVTAKSLPLTRTQSDARDDLERTLDPTRAWSPTALDAFERGPLPSGIRGFLGSLRDAHTRKR